MSGRIVKADFGPLNQMVKILSGKHTIQVGIFAPKATRKNAKGLGNPDLGAIHEFGSVSRGIAPRSFLRMPLIQYGQEIIKEGTIGMDYFLAKGNFIQVLKNIGLACEVAINRAFVTRGFGSWKPNAPSTVARKGSDMPLIDTSQLRRSIASRVKEAA